MNSIRNLLAGSLLAAAALAIAATSISVATAADDTAAPGPHGWHHHGGHLLSKLSLTADQQASVKAIMTNAGPQMKSIRQQMRANSLKLQNTQPNDPNYANVVAEVTSANGALHSQMISRQAEVRAQVFKVLTPAQQTQLAALQQARQQAWQNRFQGAPATQ